MAAPDVRKGRLPVKLSRLEFEPRVFRPKAPDKKLVDPKPK